VEHVHSGCHVAGDDFFNQVESDYQESQEERDGFQGEPVVQEEAAQEAGDKGVEALEPFLHQEDMPLIVEPVDTMKMLGQEQNLTFSPRAARESRALTRQALFPSDSER
jgi:hypothetical protein